MIIYYYECLECNHQGDKEYDLFMLPYEDSCIICEGNMELQQYEIDGETERLW